MSDFLQRLQQRKLVQFAHVHGEMRRAARWTS